MTTDTDKAREELKPCPFCGHKPWGVFGPISEGFADGSFWVECVGDQEDDNTTCGYWVYECDSRAEAVEAWNQRAASSEIAALQARLVEAERDAARYRELWTPEIDDFIKAIEREALHQRDRWGSEHDAGKTDADWFWLVGYLAGKAINKPEKKLHHIITTAAACLNWHAASVGAHTAMRPGIDAAITAQGTASPNQPESEE